MTKEISLPDYAKTSEWRVRQFHTTICRLDRRHMKISS